ncbi:TonB-dependent receptor [Novosphingobium sp. TH158]|uniref:TonB-dependent receptor n=1 Tax=Novosphingobium sp. TH158 TaxID=2067455 RepID=UPI000C79C645|nr:TonB-dependent receptor [Novosphingobium sp. TH158]PLK27324.1 TonB-dependent receptor [Novosphingobium sp. TH158]
MNLTPKFALITSCAVMALACPAFAEEAGEAAATDDTVIVVKGQGEGESLWTYAGSATVIDGLDLEARRFTNLASLSYVAPNVSLDEIGTFKGVSNFAIRGLGVNSSIPSIDPSVGLYVDGVYLGINAGTVFDALDVARVEVLRGPQGVVFGRNTTGGAVQVQTADPDFEEWSGQARLGMEGPVDDGRGSPMGTARLVVSGPLGDSLALRLGALHASDGGYFRNALTGAPVGGYDNTVLRAGLAWAPSATFKLTLKGEWNRSDGDGAPTHNNGQNPRDSFSLSINEPGYHHSRSRFVTARAEYDVGEGALTSVFGWRKYDLSTRNDIDSSPATVFHSDTRTRQEQVSNDLYYTRSLAGLDLTLGAYLFHQSMGYEEVRYLAATQYGGGRMTHDQAELYGQAVAELAAGLKLTAGLRWSHEAKQAFVTYVRPRNACSAVDGTCPTSGVNALNTSENNGFTDKASWNSLSPRIALGWQAADNAYLWGGWSRGRRSGGYNLRITQPAAFEQVAIALGSPAYQPERVDSFEAGVKWQGAGGRIGVQATAFHNDVANLQREINVPSASSGLAQSVYNTADARIRGFEVELSAQPVEGLSLSASLGHIDARYTRVMFDINSDGTINAADLALDLPRAPRWTWGLGAQYRMWISSKAEITARADFQHRSRFAYTDNNWGFNSAANRLDASLTLNLGDPAIRFSLFGRNLMDDVQFGGDTQLPFAGGSYSDGNNRPYDPSPAAGTFSPLAKGRTVGLEVAMDF